MIFETVVLIPARSGSKRILNKNIYLINEIPLIAYSIRLAVNLNYPVFVSTDSFEIDKISRDYGAKIIKRPAEYAQDKSLDIQWIKHALKGINDDYGFMPAKIILLRPTTPFRKFMLVLEAIELFKDKSTSLRSVELLDEAVEKNLRVNRGYLTPIFKNRNFSYMPNQAFKESYKANGYIDILRVGHILKHNELYGKKCQAFITPKTIEIDSMPDIEVAQCFAKQTNFFHEYI